VQWIAIWLRPRQGTMALCQLAKNVYYAQNPSISVKRRLPDALTFVDMELRRAEPTDAMAVARVHVRSWQAAYRKLMPDDYLDQLRPEDRAKKYDFGNLDPLRPHTIVATENGDIRGFATTAPAQDSNMSGYGELCALYVDPDHWGRGIGVALVSAARTRLFDFGFRSAILWYSWVTFGRSAFI
jgi:GNAT superfamily N-acetyltransferase